MSTETERITIRLPKQDVVAIDALVSSGEFSNRTAVLRRSIRDLIAAYGPRLEEATKNRQKLFETLTSANQLEELAAQLEEQRRMLDNLMRK